MSTETTATFTLTVTLGRVMSDDELDSTTERLTAIVEELTDRQEDTVDATVTVSTGNGVVYGDGSPVRDGHAQRTRHP